MPTEAGVRQHGFSPYDWNGGTIVAVAGKDFVVVAADKRLATGYNIKARNIDRICKLTPKTAVACGGCHADVMALYKVLHHRAVMYKFAHDADMSTVATAQLLSNTLYRKRFFPYYALALVAGLDAEGAGYVAGYDAVGSYLRSREGYGANGSAAQLLMPILDNSFGSIGVSSGLKDKPVYGKDDVVEIVKSAFVTCGERDIMCGDGVDILVITKDGTEEIFFELKRD